MLWLCQIKFLSLSLNEKVNCVSREEVKNAPRRMKKGKAVKPDELPLEVWKCMKRDGEKVFDQTVQQAINR